MFQDRHVGFTGSRKGMTARQLTLLKQTLRELWGMGFRVFHHGDCIGADEDAAAIAKHLGFRIHQHPPINTEFRAYAPYDVSEPPRHFLERNKEIVNQTEALIAVPNTMKEMKRSGTWATMRYATKKKRIILEIKPEKEIYT